MNEDEYQAHQSVVAAAREKQLQQYRALVLAGQQKQLQELQDATGRSSSGGGGDGRSCSGSGGAAAAKGAGDQRIGVDAAMLTMLRCWWSRMWLLLMMGSSLSPLQQGPVRTAPSTLQKKPLGACKQHIP